MTIDISTTQLRQLRAKLLVKAAAPQAIFLPQPNSPTITQINNGTYDWTQLPRWVKSIPITAHHLKQRRTIIERLCADPTGDQDASTIGLDILECSKTLPCGCPFCPYCRYKEQEKRSEKALIKFATAPKQEMAFLTVLHPVTYDPMRDAPNQINYLRNSIRNALNSRGYNQVRMLGAFEIDVKRSQDAKKPRSNRVLSALEMDTASRQPAYLIHLHSLVDLGGVSKDRVRRALTGIFDKPYQVRLSYLREDMGKEESVDRVARYMFKFRVQFADNLFGKETGLKAQYNELYPGPLMREYVKLIHSLKVNNSFKGFQFKYN